MTTTRTRANIGKANARKGKEAERHIARYLRTHGFPHAERAVRTGYNTGERISDDPGDITGTPGLVWQVKNAARDQIDEWLAETEHQTEAAGADLGVLIVRRQGKAEPGRWWVWLPVVDLGYLMHGRSMLSWRQRKHPVRMELDHLVPLLHVRGYGVSTGVPAHHE